MNETPAGAPKDDDKGKEKSPIGERLAKDVLDRYPRLARIVGWVSVVSLVAGYAATAAGHVTKLRQSLFEFFGPGGFLSLHHVMTYVTVALLALGYAAVALLVYRRYIAARASRKRRLVLASLTGAGFVGLLGVSAWATIPEAPRLENLLDQQIAHWQHELLDTQNPDGGLRWSKVDRHVESQVWSTAQVLAAVLGSGRTLDAPSARQARKAFDFMHRLQLQDAGEGWGYFEYVPWGVSEINAWVCIALARSMAGPHQAQVWPAELHEARRRLTECAALVTARQLGDGGWAPISQRDNLRFARTYSSAMSLWALLEARRTLGGDGYDEYIKRGITWLLQHYQESQGGWVPNPDRKRQIESFPGLTAQIVFVLARSPEAFDNVLAQGNYAVMAGAVARWLNGEAIPLQKETLLARPVASNDRSHDSDRYLPRSKYMVESSTFLWYPWALAACSALSDAPREGPRGVDPRANCGPLSKRVDDLVKFTRDDPFTYVTAESLLAVNAYRARLGP